MPCLHTTLGQKLKSELGIILPHEHVFVDLRTPDQHGYGQAEAEEVIRLMSPELERARAAGISAIVECSPEGVGRRVDILKAVSAATQYPLIVPTGIYREPWVPSWAYQFSEAELQAWMRSELLDGIKGTGVKAGFIKLSAGDEGLTPVETKILRAAVSAAASCQAVIASHTVRGRVVKDQLDILETCGYRAERFIWVHAHIEPDFQLNLTAARRGAWIEYDAIGSVDPGDDYFIERLLKLLEAGFADQVLLSQDRGWYDPAQPGGGSPQPYTYLLETFLPKLRSAGMSESTIHKLVCENPYRAFSRD